MFKATVLAAVCVVLLLGQLIPAEPATSDEWEEYKRQYGKVYEDAKEDSERFALFEATKNMIEEHNSKESSYKFGLNHMSDWTQSELDQIKEPGFGSHLPVIGSDSTISISSPSEFDWRKHSKRVTSVKDQGKYSTGWAFATAGCLEGRIVEVFPKMNVTSLSSQLLIDCDEWADTGSDITYGLYRVATLGGLPPEETRPYKGIKNSCIYNEKAFVISNSNPGYGYYYSGENKMADLLVKEGPIPITVATNNWNLYESGVFDDESCTKESLKSSSHSALLVGYGTDPDHGSYWIVKNSWSDKWGEDGYIRIKRGVGRCGIGDKFTIPFGVKPVNSFLA